MYLPTVIIDHDLDFTNQLSHRQNIDHSPLDPDVKNEKGYIVNRYPLGLSLSILPAFLLAHVFSTIFYGIGKINFIAPDGYTIFYQVFCCIFIMLLGFLSFLLIDSLLEKRFGVEGKVIGVAIIIFWLGSNYVYYFFREPFMVHIVSSFWVVLTIYFINSHENLKKLNTTSFLISILIVFSFSMAIICRPTNAFLGFFLCLFLWDLIRKKWILKYLQWLPVYLVSLLPIFIQMYLWYKTTGSWIHYSYGDVGFVWKNPALLKTLFSSRHGLFFWSPILVLSILGYLLAVSKNWSLNNIFLLSLILSFLTIWYANSAWKYWWFGDAFGGRAFLELQAFWVIGIGLFLNFLKKMTPYKQKLVFYSIGFCIFYNYTLMALYILAIIPRGDYLI